MNACLLCAAPLLLLVGIFLFVRKLSGLYPWEISRSFLDLLVLSWVVAYLLMLLTAGWLARCAEMWAPRRVRDVVTHHSAMGLPPSGLSPRPTTPSL